jgi:muramoyltetrapeptide carboxypeptidase
MPLRRLRPGDTVGVAALSGPVDPADLARGCAALEAMGFRVRLASNVGLRTGLLGLAGSEEARLAGYRALLVDPDVRAILFARGGYGATPLLSLLDADEMTAQPKIHCGFSDLTALSGFLLSRCGLPSAQHLKSTLTAPVPQTGLSRITQRAGPDRKSVV